MSKYKKWKKEEWAVMENENGERIEKYVNGRLCVRTAIGEMEANGEKSYIEEDIYADILESITRHNGFYKVYVQYKEVPRIVTYSNGILVATNDSFLTMKENVLGMLKNIYYPDVLRAYFDFQKGGEPTSSIEILRHRLREMSGNADSVYQIMFLKPIVEEFICTDIIKTEDSALSELDDGSFKEVIIAMLYSNKVNSKAYNTLVSAKGQEKAKEIVVDEMAKRLLKGGVR